MTDTDRPYTPRLDEVRAAIASALHYLRGSYRIRTPAKRDESIPAAYRALRFFDRWLAAHDQAVRTEEREKAARIADSERTNGWDGLSAKERIAARIRAGKEQEA